MTNLTIRRFTPAKLALAVATSLTIAACGGGIDSGGIGGSGFVEGPIEDFGSIVIAGIRIDIDEATITTNGELAEASDLKLGMRVAVSAHIDGNNATADLVEFEEELRGPVEAVDPVAASLTLLGRTVHVVEDTVLDGVDLDTLALGTRLRVSGFEEDDENVTATRIDLPTDNLVRVRGFLRSLDSDRETFRLAPVLVDFTDATFVGGASEDLANGASVSVRGTLSNNGRRLTATQLRLLDPAGTADLGDDVNIAGIVRSLTTASRFELASGRTILFDRDTEIVGGGAEDIGPGQRVRVSGEVGNLRTRVRASRIELIATRR